MLAVVLIERISLWITIDATTFGVFTRPLSGLSSSSPQLRLTRVVRKWGRSIVQSDLPKLSPKSVGLFLGHLNFPEYCGVIFIARLFETVLVTCKFFYDRTIGSLWSSNNVQIFEPVSKYFLSIVCKASILQTLSENRFFFLLDHKR